MIWRIEFAEDAERDFALILDHLIDSYISFGESPVEASERAAQRLSEILEDSHRIATAPFRGQSHDDLLPGLRHLALGKATFWFTVDDDEGVIQILSVFFGGQDQQRRILIRLLERRHDN
ncbi:KluB [Haematobacter massiliensis]|uniref:KluB n=1 Tax=Haematobacter massiliensis TaxID=195105 RepID=A0A086Y283_9RHOB|nr:type II toxin-antitoxin system RelE/ParE family toxin [Haematobacter massiliensis]KFI28383.1 KluB [Haematobacter massiliensis]OWJ84679.1 RelE/ParE family toxin [Haematobacter massiliensis]QBJ26355.1 type II toxin-antitoxin system RelE/ParE family toxin [Haematobacter massiliensis]